MSKTKSKQRDSEEEEVRQDAQGVDINMQANIPEEQEGAEKVDLDQTAKTNDLGDGVHKNSKTFGTVVSDHCPDAAGLTPEQMAADADKRSGTVKSSEHGDKKDDKKKKDDK
jgi:hypothetical protein